MKRLILPLAALLAVACNSGTDESGGTTTTGGTATTTAANATGGTAAAGNAASFTTVADLATKNCMPCHAADKHAGGLDLTSYEALMKGGEHGSPVKAGDPDNSLLVKVLKGPVDDPKVPMMPIKHPPLPAEDIQKISDWIKAGAKDA